MSYRTTNPGFKPMTPIIFLDIDGILNGHQFDPHAGSNSIDRVRIEYLNMILEETGALLVLSSAWRYMILNGATTLDGFEYMLRTHGLIKDRLYSHTISDEELPLRGDQIVEWRERSVHVGRYMILDDGDTNTFGFRGLNHFWVEGDIGLTRSDTTAIINNWRTRGEFVRRVQP